MATANGQALEHRVVLYDAIGPGEHICHYADQPASACCKVVRWESSGFDRLTVEHLDGNRSNNSLENLRPCCRSCNSMRHGARPETAKQMDLRSSREEARRAFRDAYAPQIETLVEAGYRMADVAMLIGASRDFLCQRSCWYSPSEGRPWARLDPETFAAVAEILAADDRPLNEILVEAILAEAARKTAEADAQQA